MVELSDLESAEDVWGHESDPDQYVVMAIDPGVTTGWSVMGVHPDAVTSGDPAVRLLSNIEFWVAGQIDGDEDEQADFLVDLAAAWPSARLVIEDFILRKMTMGRELLSPVRITAKVEFAVRPRYFVKQSSSLAMSTVTDERQKMWKLWIPGKEHARDATKHCVTFLKRQRERAIKAAGATSGEPGSA